MVKITIATIISEPLVEYKKQLYDFFGDNIEIEECLLDCPKKITGEIVIALTPTLIPLVKSYIGDENVDIVCLQTTIDKHQLEMINEIEDYSKAVIVSAYRFYAKETAKVLNKAVKSTLNLKGYYQAMGDRKFGVVDVGIYVGDESLKPNFIKRFINIGWKKVHPQIYRQIIHKLFPNNKKLRDKLDAYGKEIVNIDFSQLIFEKLKYEFHIEFRGIINCIKEGIIVLDELDNIVFYSDKVCKLFGVNKDEYSEEHVSTVPIFHDMREKLMEVGDEVEIDICFDKRYFKVSKNVMYFESVEFRKIYMVKEVEDVRLINSNNKPKYEFRDIHYSSSAMKECIRIAKKISKIDSPTLIVGETGTGKELFAHAIHNNSHRRYKPFYAVNCTVFQESLLESELFGYEPGAFTGALKGGSKGIFEIANGGTVFLDEIGDAPMNIQVKLLRVLEEKEIRRVGGKDSIAVDVRIISATNKELKAFIDLGEFRRDLYYRLNTFILNIPPLRERKEDIRVLIIHYLNSMGYSYKIIDNNLFNYMLKLPWEGNIRELKNCVDYLGYMSGLRIGIKDLPIQYQEYISVKSTVEMPAREQDNIMFKDVSLSYNRIATFVLQQLYEQSMGRRKLLELALENGLNTSEHSLRKITNLLKEKSLIELRKGRGGAVITDKGIKLIRSNKY